MKRISFFFIMVSLIALPALTEASWKDRISDFEGNNIPTRFHPALHIAGAGVIAYGFSSLASLPARKVPLSEPRIILNVSLGVAAGLGATIAKEVFDKSCGYNFDGQSLVYGSLGAALGEGAYLLQEYLIKKKKSRLCFGPNSILLLNYSF